MGASGVINFKVCLSVVCLLLLCCVLLLLFVLLAAVVLTFLVDFACLTFDGLACMLSLFCVAVVAAVALLVIAYV